jgi:hypothetical protein
VVDRPRSGLIGPSTNSSINAASRPPPPGVGRLPADVFHPERVRLPAGSLKLEAERLLVLHEHRETVPLEVAGEHELVVVDVLAEAALPRDDDRQAADPAGVHDRAGSARQHDDVGGAEALEHLVAGEHLTTLRDRRRRGAAVLDEHLVVGVRLGPPVGPRHEPVERVDVAARAEQDAQPAHRTGPTTTAPGLGPSCSSHWTAKRSVTGRTRRPVSVAESRRSYTSR